MLRIAHPRQTRPQRPYRPLEVRSRSKKKVLLLDEQELITAVLLDRELLWKYPILLISLFG
jgi:hypothetical protein